MEQSVSISATVGQPERATGDSKADTDDHQNQDQPRTYKAARPPPINQAYVQTELSDSLEIKNLKPSNANSAV